MSSMIFEATIPVSWGDCDPAGIIFYPNHFRFFDAVFQRFLQRVGANQALFRDRFGAIGLGLLETTARFLSPVENGDLLTLTMTGLDWKARTLRVDYHGTCDGRDVIEGHELRGLFVRKDGRLRAAELAPLRALLEDMTAR